MIVHPTLAGLCSHTGCAYLMYAGVTACSMQVYDGRADTLTIVRDDVVLDASFFRAIFAVDGRDL